MKERSEVIGKSAVIVTDPAPDGSRLVGIGASDPRLIEPTRKIVEQECGIKLEPITQGDSERPRNHQFGFYSWNAHWQPRGPEKNNLPA